MRYLTLLLFLFLIGCATPSEPEVISGEEINIYVEGYEDMCEREPNSILCQQPEENDDETQQSKKDP